MDKRLYKTENGDKMICGVCGGMAEYFGIDPTLVRVAGDRRVHGLLWAVGVYPVRHRDAPEERRIPPAVTTHPDLGGQKSCRPFYTII